MNIQLALIISPKFGAHFVTKLRDTCLATGVCREQLHENIN